MSILEISLILNGIAAFVNISVIIMVHKWANKNRKKANIVIDKLKEERESLIKENMKLKEQLLIKTSNNEYLNSDIAARSLRSINGGK